MTETPTITRALDRAAERRPGERRSKLLLRLVDVGGAALEQSQRSVVEAHEAAVTAGSGAYADAFDPDHLAQLRQDWPA